MPVVNALYRHPSAMLHILTMCGHLHAMLEANCMMAAFKLSILTPETISEH